MSDEEKTIREMLIAAGCKIDGDCHLPTVLKSWLSLIRPAMTQYANKVPPAQDLVTMCEAASKATGSAMLHHVADRLKWFHGLLERIRKVLDFLEKDEGCLALDPVEDDETKEVLFQLEIEGQFFEGKTAKEAFWSGLGRWSKSQEAKKGGR
jgi:hypothetical protein